ncbi:MAG TPA: argininosuccinate lyase [Bacteroidales bacterium]|nr:argininosuccinate lyase [Bacteroidales bacterium]
MKLWDKGTPVNQRVEQFTVGRDREMDKMLAKADILGSLAHIAMLNSIGLIADDELKLLSAALKDIYKNHLTDFTIEPGVEDVHSQIELMLTRKLGDVGKKIHSGRSRNDQVLVDIKIFAREQIREIHDLILTLFETLVALSEKHKNVLIPGYTHLQIAMPSSFGLWFGAYAESLTDDLLMLQTAYRITNQNPLGSAAGYGSSFPLNRTMTTKLLGFETLNFNVIYAQMNRGKTEKTISFALSSIAATLAKMSMDICLFMSQNFSFVSFPDELTTGSSIMPHKKNPDVFELIRAKGNRIQALPNEISMMLTNLTSGYHRDFQLLKEILFPAMEDMKAMLDIANMMLQNIRVKDDILKDEKYKYIFSVEEVNRLVLKGVPFRDAYKQVGGQIAEGKFNPSLTVKHTHEGSIGNLCNENIRKKMQNISEGFCFANVDKALQHLLQ